MLYRFRAVLIARDIAVLPSYTTKYLPLVEMVFTIGVIAFLLRWHCYSGAFVAVYS